MQWMEGVRRAGVFIICAQILVHLRPNGYYEKYLKMLVSAMILLQLFAPVSTFLTAGSDRGIAARVLWYEEQLQEAMQTSTETFETWEQQMEVNVLNGWINAYAPAASEEQAAEQMTQSADDARRATETIRVAPVRWDAKGEEAP